MKNLLNEQNTTSSGKTTSLKNSLLSKLPFEKLSFGNFGPKSAKLFGSIFMLSVATYWSYQKGKKTGKLEAKKDYEIMEYQRNQVNLNFML